MINITDTTLSIQCSAKEKMKMALNECFDTIEETTKETITKIWLTISINIILITIVIIAVIIGVIVSDGKKRGQLFHVLTFNNTKLSVFDRSTKNYICQIMGFEFNLFESNIEFTFKHEL